MYLDDYAKVTLDKFNGLYDRGNTDEVPQDHASDILNVMFSKNAEVSTRNGTAISLTLGHAVVRQFLATFSNSSSFVLTCNGAGSIFSGTGAALLTVANMIDFAAINMYNYCFIAPILSTFSATNYVYIWDGVNAPRPAAGFAPSGSFTAANSATVGNITSGVHKFAVSNITNSGFTTRPGPQIAGTFTPVSVTATGGFKVDLSGIPLGPTGTVARQIFVTQADQEVYFYLAVGFINDNTTTAITVDFFDTDLAVSADNLFDLREYIPSAAVISGGLSLQKYHGRLLAIGVQFDTVLVSNAGDAESFSNVTGYIQIPSENDGNTVRAACVLYDVLYFTKAVGIFSVQDNGNTPSTWTVVQIDGSVGSYQGAIGTITGSQPSLASNSVILMANREGIFLFNGTVQRPHLTWKIQDVWGAINPGKENLVQIAVDAFADLIYVILATGSSTTPNLMLVGDFSQGLDEKNIRWSKYSFPWVPISISMMNFQDTDGSFDYYLRLGTSSNLYKLNASYTSDSGTAINSYWQTFLASQDIGALNIFRALRFRTTGVGTLSFTMAGEDGQGAINSTAAQNITLGATPGKDGFCQINFTNEKMSVKFGVNAVNSRFTVQRLDIFCKRLFLSRPA